MFITLWLGRRREKCRPIIKPVRQDTAAIRSDFILARVAASVSSPRNMAAAGGAIRERRVRNRHGLAVVECNLRDPAIGGRERVAESAVRVVMALALRPAGRLADATSMARGFAAGSAGALLILSYSLFSTIAAAVEAVRLPAIILLSDSVRPGGLLAYSPDVQGLFRRAGAIALRIVDGARASEFAVERLLRFNLIVDLRTANALSLNTPPLLLAHADEVVE